MARIDTTDYLEMTKSIIAILDANIEIIPAIKEEFSLVPCFLPEDLVHEANENTTVLSQLEEYIENKFKYKFPIEVQLNGSKGFMIRLAIGKDGGFREHTLPIIMGKVKNRYIEDKNTSTIKVPFRLSKDELELLDSKINQKTLLHTIAKLIGIPKEDIQSYEFSSIGLQMKRHTPWDSAKHRLYVLYGGKLGAKLTTLFTNDMLNMAVLNMEVKEFITKTLKAYNMDTDILKKLSEMEDKQDTVTRVLNTLQYGIERLLCSDNILGAILHIPSARLLKELDKLEKENPLFPQEYLKKDKNTILDLASFQLYIMTLTEVLIRENITTAYSMDTDRYGYKKKVETLIKYILADAKHPEIKEARSMVVDFMNRLHDYNPSFSVIQSQETISRYHGLNKNFEVVDVSSIIKTLEQIKKEIDAINTIINPTFKLISLQRKILVFIDQVGVEINTKDSKILSKLRFIISALKQPKARFKRKDLQFILNISSFFLREHAVKHILEYQSTLQKVLIENSIEYIEIKDKLGEYPWRELSTALREKGKLTFSKIIKLDKHIDNSKEKVSDNPEDNLQDGFAQVLNKSLSSLIHYIDEEKKEIEKLKRGVLELKNQVLEISKQSDQFAVRLEKFETAKKEYETRLAQSLFFYADVDSDVIINVNERSMTSSKLEDIRRSILRCANAFYDTQIEVIQNLEVLNGRKTKTGVTVGLLKELLNVWDIKEKQLQIKYRELKNSQGEQNQQIEDEIATLINEIAEFLIEQQLFSEPINQDPIYIKYMPKNNIQIIEAQITDIMSKKNNAQDTIRKFLIDYTFVSANPEKSKLTDGVFELYRRKTIHDQDKDKFVALINKHFDLMKEKDTIKEKLMFDFEMPQRLISVADETHIMKPIDMSKDMQQNVVEAIKDEHENQDIIIINEGKKPKHLVLEDLIKKLTKTDCKCEYCKLEAKAKYIQNGNDDNIIIALGISYKNLKEIYKNQFTLNGEKYEEYLPKLIQKYLVESAKEFLSKVDDVKIKKDISEKLKIYIEAIANKTN